MCNPWSLEWLHAGVINTLLTQTAFAGNLMFTTGTKVGGNLMGEVVDAHHVIVAFLVEVED